MSILGELRRRHVIKVAVAYAIVSWLLVQIAAVLVPALRLPEWVLSLVVLLLTLGFPVAFFLTWAYELTPEGVRRAGAVSLPERVRWIAGRRLDFAIMGLLAAALAFVVVDQYLLEEQGDAGPAAELPSGPSVAVLPFVSLSGDPEQAYFSDGISEELLSVLSRVPGLRVPSRTSSFAFRGADTPLETIAEELAVDHVLEGSVRRDGEQVRVSAQLVDVATNSPLWSQTYNRELTGVFEIQDEIAARVAEALQIRLLAEPGGSASRTANTEAHDAYLRGLAYVSTLASGNVARAIESFERAITADPEYAAAYAMLARTYNVARLFDFMDPQEAAARASAAVDRAIELGLDNANAHVSQSQVLLRQGRYAEARRALETAASLEPRSAELNWRMGTLRLNRGDHSGARGYYQRAIRFEPTSPTAYAGIGDVETFEGRLDEAVRWYVAGLEQDPGQGHMMTWVGFLYISLDDEARAGPWLERGAALLEARGTAHDFISEFIPLVMHGDDPARLIELVRGVSPGLFGPFGTRIFRKIVTSTGDEAEIRAYFEEFWPGLFTEDPAINIANLEAVPDVVSILRSGGQTEEAETMLREALRVFRDNDWPPSFPMDPAAYLVEAEILTLLGTKTRRFASSGGKSTKAGGSAGGRSNATRCSRQSATGPNSAR